jgi:hypothetical protein
MYKLQRLILNRENYDDIFNECVKICSRDEQYQAWMITIICNFDMSRSLSDTENLFSIVEEFIKPNA